MECVCENEGYEECQFKNEDIKCKECNGFRYVRGVQSVGVAISVKDIWNERDVMYEGCEKCKGWTEHEKCGECVL